jgi:predicted secreted Zn-dependent protease
VRLLPILLLVVVSASAGQGCAGQDRTTRAAELAAMNSSDDAQCRAKGAPGSPAYAECRKAVAQKRTQAVVQEQKRRDFDRVLGNGTGGFDENY